MKPKLAIVMSGGGMRCAYSLGVLAWVHKQLGGLKPAIVIGGSGSSGIAAYVAAGQFDDICSIWQDHVPSQDFINRRRLKHMVDLEYLMTVVRDKKPLNIKAFHRSKTQGLVAALNYQTGRVRYFSNRNKKDNILIGMKASAAAPFITNSPVIIQGIPYGDSFLSTNAKLHAIKAQTLGATHIIMIENGTDDFLTQRIHDLWLQRRTPEFRERYRKLLRTVHQHAFSDLVEIISLRPSKPLEVGLLDTNVQRLQATIEQGEHDAANHPKLKQFIRQLKKSMPIRDRLRSLVQRIPLVKKPVST